jgi:hypothetical protein
VLPPTVRAQVSVEAGVPMGWLEFVGNAGRIAGLDHFGAGAACTVLYEQSGLTADAVVVAARESLAAAGRPDWSRQRRRPAHPHPAIADPQLVAAGSRLILTSTRYRP